MMQLDLMAAPSARRFAAYHRPGVALSMTAARRQPGVLMRRCRGARAVATFSGDIAARLGELSTYGMDRVSRR